MSKPVKITLETYELKSIRFNRKDGKIDIEWIETVSEGGATHKIPKAADFSFNPQPALVSLLDKMNVYVARTNGYPETNLYTDKIFISGVSISGGEKGKKVIIVGGMKADNKRHINILSPLIDLKNDIFHIESDLHVDLEDLEKESFKFVFEGARGQLSIKLDEEEKEDETQPELFEEETK